MDPYAIASAGNAVLNSASQFFNNSQMTTADAENYDRWKRQNAYNHPKEQLKRLKEAGLNPYLMYGQGVGGGGTGNASPPPQTNAKSLDLNVLSDAVNMYLDLKAKDTNIENTTLDIAGKTHDNVVKQNDADYSNWFNKTMMSKIPDPDELLSPRATGAKLQLQKFQKDIEGSEKDNTLKSQDIESYNIHERPMLLEEQRRNKLYNIFPNDPEAVQTMKILAKDVFGMEWEAFRKMIITSLNPFK